MHSNTNRDEASTTSLDNPNVSKHCMDTLISNNYDHLTKHYKFD